MEICEFRSGNHVGVDVVGVVFRVVSWSVGVIQTCQVLQLREEDVEEEEEAEDDEWTGVALWED